MNSLHKLLGIKFPFYQNDKTVSQSCTLAFRNTASKRQIWDFNLSVLALNLIPSTPPYNFELCWIFFQPFASAKAICFPHTISIFIPPEFSLKYEENHEPYLRNLVQLCPLPSVMPSIPLVYKTSKALALRSLKSSSFVLLSQFNKLFP